MTVLILGGTAEARALARVLLDQGRPVLSSLAGRVSDPALPPGPVRIGGFGGVSGLQHYLVEHRIAAVVDLTHPFAAHISANAALAAAEAGCPLLRLERPGWRSHPGADRWTWVPDTEAALDAGRSARRPFLTTGRQSLDSFLPWSDRHALVRVVDPPSFALPAPWQLIRSRGPYTYAGERELLLDHRADLLVTKDSGGSHTQAKLDAADTLGIAVVVIARPPHPSSGATVSSVDEVVAWLATTRAGHPVIRSRL